MGLCKGSVKTFGAPTKNSKTSMFRELSGGVCHSLQFSEQFVADLKVIDEEYVTQIANKNYSVISTEFDRYLTLYNSVVDEQNDATNKNLVTLFNITMNGLKGAVELYALYKQNITLEITNSILDKRVETILSDKNSMSAMTGAHGTIEISKTFLLAPLFSYYIRAFGLPEFGVGFDPKKLDIIKEILESNNIDLYK